MLEVSGEKITYRLRFWETLGAFGASPHANLKNILEVKFVENPWTKAILRGIRAPGTGLPYLIMLGTMRHRKGKDFCVIYKKNPVIVIELENEKYSRWVIPDNSINRQQLKLINN